MNIKISKSLYALIAVVAFWSCEVHQWPEPNLEPVDGSTTLPEEPTPDDGTASGDVDVVLDFNFSTAMKYWRFNYVKSNHSINESNDDPEEAYDNTLPFGVMRTIVRFYVSGDGAGNGGLNYKEYVFYRNLDGSSYNFSQKFTLPEGEYTVLAWSDFRNDESDNHFHDATDFSGIELVNHVGNTDYRDAFKGVAQLIKLEAPEDENSAVTNITVEMKRPLAKFELVIDNFAETMNKVTSNSKNSSESEYKILIAYPGYMPTVYNLKTDRTVDAATGMSVQSTFNMIDSNRASLGFDYYFNNDARSSAEVIVYVTDNENNVVAKSATLIVPTRRDMHTVVTGDILSVNSSGGVGIDPGFDDDININPDYR